MASPANAPYPVPTPYENPAQGGNPYVQPGLIGPSVPASSHPVASVPGGGYVYNTGQVSGGYGSQITPTNTGSTLGVTNQSIPTSQPPSSPPPSGQSRNNDGSSGNWWNDSQNMGYLNGQLYRDKNQWLAAGGQVGGGNEDINAAIADAYNASMGYLSTAEQNLRNNLGILQGQAESDYSANSAQLGADRSKSLGQLDTQQQQGQSQKEDALAAARRLYQELSTGVRQRFGAGSSAGQAASEIMSAQLQSQMGQTNRQANQFMQQVSTARNDVENQYQAGLMKLKQAKDQALSSAQLEFNNQITQIAQSRAQTESEKSNMRLQALMDLRNKAFAIQQQNLAFEQQLQAMKEQSNLQIQQYQQTLGSANTTGTNAFNTFMQNTTTNPQNQYQIGPQNMSSEAVNPQYLGKISNQNQSKSWLDNLLGT